MGTHKARQSAGRVAVLRADSWDESRDGHRKVLIVGGLGPSFPKKGGLRVYGSPISGVLVRGPVEIEELAVGSSSNPSTAKAAWTGAEMLSAMDRKAVFLVEGQSDETHVVRLRSFGQDGETTVFPDEHREEMFCRENIVRKVLRHEAYRGLVAGDPYSLNPVTDERVTAAARHRAADYLAAKAAGEPECIRHLGRSLALLNMSEGAIDMVAQEIAG